jgi:hypothetical protein
MEYLTEPTDRSPGHMWVWPSSPSPFKFKILKWVWNLTVLNGENNWMVVGGRGSFVVKGKNESLISVENRIHF